MDVGALEVLLDSPDVVIAWLVELLDGPEVELAWLVEPALVDVAVDRIVEE